MSADESEDRRAILARRAALVAGALASVGVGRRAEAQEPPMALVDCTRREPSPEERAEAERLLRDGEDRAVLAQPMGDLLERAYALAPSAGVAMRAMAAYTLAEDLDRAHDIGERELECRGHHHDIATDVRRIEQKTGRLRIRTSGGRPTSLEIDGRPLPPSRAERGFWLPPGEHRVKVGTDRETTHRKVVSVAAGETTDVELDVVAAQPCLSIVPRDPPPEPCLSISTPEHEERYALHIGVVPAVTITGDDPPRVLGGGGARFSIAVQVEKDLWFDGDVFALLTYGDDTLLDTVGTVAELRWHPNGCFGFGAGFSGGLTAASYDGALDPMQEGMFGPVIVPASFLTKDALIELRVPLWLTATIDGQPEHDLRLGQITPHLVVSWGIPGRILKRAF